MAFCLTFLVAVAAVAIDGGLIMDDVQKVQAAADASALAAVQLLPNSTSLASSASASSRPKACPTRSW
jgi:Flp pilus assembly protein TadG